MARTLKYVTGSASATASGGQGLTLYTVPAGKMAEVFIATLSISGDGGYLQLLDGCGILLANLSSYGPGGIDYTDVYEDVGYSGVSYASYGYAAMADSDVATFSFYPYPGSANPQNKPVRRRYYLPEGGTIKIYADYYTSGSYGFSSVSTSLFIVEEDV